MFLSDYGKITAKTIQSGFSQKTELPYPVIHIIKSTATGRVTLAQKSGMFHIRSNVPPYQLDIIDKSTMWNQWNVDF
jgi:hypothetical protein